MDSYDWIAFLPMADGSGAYNRYFGRLDTGKMKVRGVATRKGDTPDYVRKMQQELFDCLALARSREALGLVEAEAREVFRKFLDGLNGADVKDLAIHRRVGRLNYSRRCAEGSAVQAYQISGFNLAPGMEIGYVVKDASRWEVDPEMTADRFDSEYHGKLMEKAWDEVAFVFSAL